MNIKIFSLLAVFCWFSYAHANVESDDPKIIVQQVSNRVITALTEDADAIRANPDKVSALINEHITPHFDLEKISHFVLGKVWQQATETQQADFQREFKHLLVGTYSAALLEYSGDDQIIYKDAKISPKNPNVAIVPTEVRQKGSDPIEVTYRMLRTDGQWRIYDIVISGVSLVTNYRADFAGQVRDNGLDGLIATLNKHNQKKGGGPL